MRKYIALGITLATLLAGGCGKDKKTHQESYLAQNTAGISIDTPGIPKEQAYSTGTPATILIGYSGNGYHLHINGGRVDFGNSKRASELEKKGILITRGALQQSGYRHGNDTPGIDVLAINSLYPGELEVRVTGYDNSRDSLTIVHDGPSMFRVPKLETKEDTLKFAAISYAKATGKSVSNKLTDLWGWVKSKASEAGEEIDRWRSEKGKGEGKGGGKSSEDTY